ncbi:transglutaminase-like domain-containing protein [Oscillibacter sp.]|uniref:transglutaminase-like domain-containing protein n=1 Tax=Oscillibacter sp. TaxID=1945593 RepID=UPI0028A1DD2E|nr:transglutaminase-like domain-containing protein [Oscillibacter sp.]
MGINDNFRYLHIGLPEDVLRLKYFGEFAGADRAALRYLNAPNTPEPLKRCLTAQREMMARLPADYPLTREEAVALAQSAAPDFTAEEFDALTEAGRIDWIYIQGVPHYFDRFFDSLCKTDASYAARAGASQLGADGSGAAREDGESRLDRVARLLAEKGELSARIRCRASLRLKEGTFRKGERVRAYLPLPCACDAQSELRIERISPEPAHISPEDAPQRVAFWEERMEENHPFEVEFSYVRTARYADLTSPGKSGGESAYPPEEFLAEEPPHLLFTPYLRALTAELTAGVEEPLEKARRLYDFVTLNVKYTYVRAYFGLENIAENCARNLVGDCGVMALLFITLCRCAGVPARWESGWKAEPGFCGAHDWARFYIAPHGWLYADPSFGAGAVREGNEARRRFYFGNLDSYRMTANTAFQAAFDVPQDHWRADPYDNQVGEMELTDRGLRYEEFERTKEVLEFTEL